MKKTTKNQLITYLMVIIIYVIVQSLIGAGKVSSLMQGLLVPVSRNLDSRSAAEGQLKGYLRNRGEWLDENIETLRQYSAPSRVKQYNEIND